MPVHRFLIFLAAAFVVVAGLAAPASAKKAKPAASLAVSAPPRAVAGQPVAVTVTALTAKGKPATSYRGTVKLSAAAGSAKLPAAYRYKRSDRGRHVFNGAVLTRAGAADLVAADASKARIRGSSRVAVVAGKVRTVRVTAPATVAAGEAFRPAATATDAYGNRVDLAGAQMSIAPDGSCTAGACSAEVAGQHVVTVQSGSAAGTAQTTVTAGEPAALRIEAPGSVVAGESFAPVVTATDAHGNDLGDITDEVELSVDGVTCDASGCTATKAGERVLRAALGDVSATAAVTVEPGPVADIAISAVSSTRAGSAIGVRASATDRFGNPRGDVTAATAFSISPDGSCGADRCTATSAGQHTITARHAGMTAQHAVRIDAGPLARLEISRPGGAIAPARPQGPNAAYAPKLATSKTMTTRGFDSYGNPLGDYSGRTTFTQDTGSCSANSCTGGQPGTRQVTATAEGVSATTTVDYADVESGWTMTCQGQGYDVNQDQADGCEQVMADAGHSTRDSAIYLGSKPCHDSQSRTEFTTRLLTDARRGSTARTSSVQFKVHASGGACLNDMGIKVTTAGGRGDVDPCYEVEIYTGRYVDEGRFTGSESRESSTGSGYYSDGADIYFTVSKVCDPGPEAVDVNVSFHL